MKNKNNKALAIVLIMWLLTFGALLCSFASPALAQITATPTNTTTPTFTPTATATNTPTQTPTNTPIATVLPMAVSVSGFSAGYRCGLYGYATDAGTDCFQAQNGTGISAYSTAGAVTFHLDGTTGVITDPGWITYSVKANYTTGTSITHGMGYTPTICFINPVEITATYTITSGGFSSNTATHSNPIYWMCVR